MTEPDQIPERLRQAFAGLRPSAAMPPRRVDETIVRSARARMAPARPRRLRWWLSPAAAAAALLAWFLLRTAGLAGDVDGSGRIDILDAFALARRLDAGAVTDVRLDLTGEGAVDRQDVKEIARLAVALDGGGR